MLRLLNVTRRMAVIELTGGQSIRITRSRADGTTVGFQSAGMRGWKTLDVSELLDAITFVTAPADALIDAGMDERDVKPTRKRNYKAERERREQRKKDREDWGNI